MLIALRAFDRSSKLPLKNSPSVRTETAEAPASSYAFTTSSTAEVLLMSPFDGDALLYSAIIPVFSGSRIDSLNDRQATLK
ncbi:hypothetical protein D3C72_1164890 [compost metagenome]